MHSPIDMLEPSTSSSVAEIGDKTQTRKLPVETHYNETIAQQTSKPESSAADEVAWTRADDQKTKTLIRKGVFFWGSVFLGLGVIDGISDPFSAPALYFGATGASLVIGAITGQPPKQKDAS